MSRLAGGIGGALARRAYGLLTRLLMPAMLLRLWWRGRREPLYRHALRERLGHADGEPVPGRLWLHAVSLGETRAAAALLEALRAQRPGLAVLLTHGTATGRAAGAALLREGDAQAWLPWDSPPAVHRFLAAHRPAIGVLMETEVWPTLMQAAADDELPMVLANARLSERSLARGERFGALIRPAVAVLARVLAQTEDDAARLRRMGARRVEVCGNLKFDMNPDRSLVARGAASRGLLQRPVVLAASTREGEEAELLDAWLAAVDPADARRDRPLLLIVPRHPQRFDEVAGLCRARGLGLSRRSQWSATGLPPDSALPVDVWIGDSLGEMPLYYGMADAALLGGSFAPLGGQNLIEATACGCPIVVGPSTFNFAEAADLAVAAGVALRAADLPSALAQALALAADAPRRARLSADALAFTAAHRGAAARMAEVILRTLDRAQPTVLSDLG